MISGVGIDIIDIARIQSLYQRHGRRFLHRVFTDKEIDYCESNHYTAQHLSVRFAAKEAVVKALGTGFTKGIVFKDIEVIKEDGPPGIILYNAARQMADRLDVSKIHLSISHDRGCAIAFVVLENAK